MSLHRPYIDPDAFRYPGEPSGGAPLFPDHAATSSDALEYLDLDDLVGSHTQLAAVGLRVSRFYARMLVAQPFEVSRFLLQVGEFGGSTGEGVEYEVDDGLSSSEEEVDYFVDTRDTAAADPTPVRRPKPTNRRARRKLQPISTTSERGLQLFDPQRRAFPESLDITQPYVFACLGALTAQEGVFGMWRGLNASCLLRAATGIVQAWATSFIAASTHTPDPQFVDVLAAVDPGRLVAVGVAGCAVAAALLTPLAVIRARLLATSRAKPDRPRSLRWQLLDAVRRGQLVASPSVVAPTTLAAAAQFAAQRVAPLVLWQLGGISPLSAPLLSRLGQLATSCVALGVTMPLETLASRAQLRAGQPAMSALIVRPTAYAGVWATLWAVLKGEVPLSSLYRGWRSEVLGMLGEWGYEALDEYRPEQERF